MTTTRNYKYGKHTCRAYNKPVGHGYEVGFVFGGKPIFVGNFIHPTEAKTWWSTMNREINRFSRKYWTTPKAPIAFYSKFLTQYLYKCYYTFLDKKFGQYNRGYAQGFKQHERRYTSMRKNWPTTNGKVYFRKSI